MNVVIVVCLQCVICLSARAIIEALPCGHKVLCRKCFIKTIQTAIAQRSLPLKCIVCRSKVLKINNPDLDGVGVGGGGGVGSQMASSRPRPKSSSVARCRADYSQTSNAAAAQTTMTSHSTTTTTTKATPVRGDGRTKASHHQSPIVATKLMQPLLIYPSRSSPVQQRAFLTRTAVDACATPRSLRSSSSSSSRHPTTTSTTTEATSEAKRTSRFQNLFLRGS